MKLRHIWSESIVNFIRAFVKIIVKLNLVKIDVILVKVFKSELLIPCWGSNPHFNILKTDFYIKSCLAILVNILEKSTSLVVK